MSPSSPLLTISRALRKNPPERCMVPPCTTRSYLRAAWIIFRPSSTYTQAGFAGFDGHVGVPVIGRGNAHGIHRLVRQDLAKVVNRFDAGETALARPFHRGIEGRL